MIVELNRRHYGVYAKIRSIWIDVDFEEIYIEEDNINEEKLLVALPNGFLPCHHSKILVGVQTSKDTTTMQRGLTAFKNFSKYYDAYAIILCNNKTKPEVAQ